MAYRSNAERGSSRIALGAFMVVLSGLLLMRAAGPWPGDSFAWPVLVALAGALLIWRSPVSVVSRHRAWAAHRSFTPREASTALESAARLLPRPQVSRRGLGITLVLGAGIAALWANGAIRPAGEAVLTAIVVLAAEQAARVRSQERADVGAHLHDSVLQTLALIQRSADDPRRVAALARTQERELRAWLAGEEPVREAASLGEALKAAAVEVEDAANAAVEVVVVGESELDEPAAATLAAAREAMLNAAKFAGDGAVSVFAELSSQRIVVFVRDRGPGFDPTSVSSERHGVRESIIGRMQRAGGRATVRSASGTGTEVELALERRGRA